MAKSKTSASAEMTPGMLYAFPVYDGRFGCLQILPDDEPGNWVRLCALNALWTNVPSVDEALAAKLRTRATIDDRLQPDVTCVRPLLPYWAIPIGVGRPLPSEVFAASMGNSWRSVLDVWRDCCPIVEGQTGATTLDDNVTHHEITVKKPTTLAVPAALERLSVSGDASLLTIKGITGKFPFVLNLGGPRVESLPRGLPELEKVRVHSDYFDARAVAGHRHLKGINLTGEKSGALAHAEALASLSELRGFVARDCYALDGANFPELTSVEYLSLRWVRRSDAEAIKKKLKCVRYRIVLGTRTDEWIADNADNPFRDWEDEAPALARGAKKAWKAARAAKRAKPEKVLQTLLDELNKLDAKHDLETHHREQAWDAFLLLAKDLGVPQPEAEKIFDQRSF